MKATIFSNDFNRIIDATKDFVGQDERRGVHRFIRLEFSKSYSNVKAIAVDGYKLSIEHAVCDCDEDFVAYINANTKLPRNINATIEMVESDVIIRCGDFIFGSPQPTNSAFLDYNKVIPTDEPVFSICANGNYLISALKAAKVSCGNSFKNPVVLEFHGEEKPIILRTNDNDIKLVLPIRNNKKRR